MSNQSANNKKIAKNTLFLYLRMILTLMVSLLTTRVVLKALGVEDYGIYNVVAGFVSMFTFLNTSMSNGIQRFYNFKLGTNDNSSITGVYNSGLQIQGLLAITILILLETIGAWYMHTQMVIPAERMETAMWVFHFSVLSILFVILQIPYSAAIIAYERMDYYAYVSIFDVVAKLLIAYLLMTTNHDRLLLYGFFNLLVSIISFFLYLIYSKNQFKHLTFRFKYYKEYFRPMLSFSGWNIFGSFAYMIKGQGLNMLLNVFFGPVVNAARGISNMIMSAIQGFQGNIVVAFRPQLVQSYSSGEFSRVKNLFYSLSKISYLMLTILSIPIILELDYILNIWLDDVIPDYTKSFTILVLVNMVISSLNTPVSQVVHATGRMKNYQIATSVVVCGILPVSWALLKLGYEPNSVYITSLLISMLNQIVCNIYLKKIFPYSLLEYVRNVILPCSIFTVLAPILPLLIIHSIPSSFARLLIVACLSVIASCIVAYIVVLNQSEKMLLLNFIKRKRT